MKHLLEITEHWLSLIIFNLRCNKVIKQLPQQVLCLTGYKLNSCLRHAGFIEWIKSGPSYFQKTLLIRSNLATQMSTNVKIQN